MAEQEALETNEETVEMTEDSPETPVTSVDVPDESAEGEASEEEDISYHAVEKDGNVTAIWETQGKKHLRTISPRSEEGKHILALFETADQ